jgi:hypothetical protein
MSGYTDRSALIDRAHLQLLDSRHNPLFNHPVISDGRIAGTWKRTLTAESATVEAKWFAEPTKAEMRNLAVAKKRMAQFYGVEMSRE